MNRAPTVPQCAPGTVRVTVPRAPTYREGHGHTLRTAPESAPTVPHSARDVDLFETDIHDPVSQPPLPCPRLVSRSGSDLAGSGQDRIPAGCGCARMGGAVNGVAEPVTQKINSPGSDHD